MSKKINSPAFSPSPSLLVKLGSIIVHQQELVANNGHYVDKHALDGLLSDPEVVAWMNEMTRLAFLPVKR